jgi:hypothetical protein
VTKLLNHLKANVVAYLALFVALGGTSYAAINLPAGSVGTRQLRSGAVTNKKLAKGSVGAADLDRKSIAGYVRAYAQIHSGQLTSSRPQATLLGWHSSGLGPGGIIKWKRPFPTSCFALAGTLSFPAGSYASAEVVSGSNRKTTDQVQVILSDGGAQTLNVVVVCPQP